MQEEKINFGLCSARILRVERPAPVLCCFMLHEAKALVAFEKYFGM